VPAVERAVAERRRRGDRRLDARPRCRALALAAGLAGAALARALAAAGRRGGAGLLLLLAGGRGRVARGGRVAR
jgi:hypothetical protein